MLYSAPLSFFHLHAFILSFIQRILIEYGSIPHFIHCLCSNSISSPSTIAPLYSSVSSFSCFLYTSGITLYLLPYWNAGQLQGHRLGLFGVWHLNGCIERVYHVSGVALPSIFSVTCINWMLSLLSLASAYCYFSHIVCLFLFFFSLF